MAVGSESGGSLHSVAGVGPEPLDGRALAELADTVAHPRAGAVVLFQGNVRSVHQGRSVDGITYTAYQSMAHARLQRIVDELSTGDRVERDDRPLASHVELGQPPGVGLIDERLPDALARSRDHDLELEQDGSNLELPRTLHGPRLSVRSTRRDPRADTGPMPCAARSD